MTTPDPPSAVSNAPDVADDETPAAVIAQDGGTHVDLGEDCCQTIGFVHPLLCHGVGVHVVVLEHVEPAGARHLRRRGVDQYQCKVLIKNALCSQTIPSVDRIVEPLHSGCQIIGGHVHILARANAAGSMVRAMRRGNGTSWLLSRTRGY